MRQFFRYADVGDHIRPIFDEVESRKKEELEENFSTVEITKLLDELEVKQKGGESDDDVLDLPEYDTESDNDDDDDTDEDEDRGLFHYEVKNEVGRCGTWNICPDSAWRLPRRNMRIVDTEFTFVGQTEA